MRWFGRSIRREPMSAHVRATLGESDFEAAWSRGKALTPEQVLAEALDQAIALAGERSV
jgi:hypothetical protein